MKRVALSMLALALAGAAEPPLDHTRVDIPLAYRGTWALDPKLCKQKDLGPAFVQIRPRQIAFYEDFGYLFIAQLNEADNPPEFFGRFHFVNNFNMYDETVRLDMVRGRIYITRKARPDGVRNVYAWTKCSGAER